MNRSSTMSDSPDWPDRFVVREDDLLLGASGTEVTPADALGIIATSQRRLIAGVRSLAGLVLGLVAVLSYLVFIWIDPWSVIGLMISGAAVALTIVIVAAMLLLRWGFRRIVPEEYLQQAWNDSVVEARWNGPRSTSACT
jgi:membrane glycosyltransferase